MKSDKPKDRPKSRINGKINPEYQRWYAEERKKSGNPVIRGRSAERQREWRKTEKGKADLKKYRSTQKFKDSQNKYRKSAKGKETLRISRARRLGADGYADEVIKSLDFYSRSYDAE